MNYQDIVYFFIEHKEMAEKKIKELHKDTEIVSEKIHLHLRDVEFRLVANFNGDSSKSEYYRVYLSNDGKLYVDYNYYDIEKPIRVYFPVLKEIIPFDYKKPVSSPRLLGIMRPLLSNMPIYIFTRDQRYYATNSPSVRGFQCSDIICRIIKIKHQTVIMFTLNEIYEITSWSKEEKKLMDTLKKLFKSDKEDKMLVSLCNLLSGADSSPMSQIRDIKKVLFWKEIPTKGGLSCGLGFPGNAASILIVETIANETKESEMKMMIQTVNSYMEGYDVEHVEINKVVFNAMSTEIAKTFFSTTIHEFKQHLKTTV